MRIETAITAFLDAKRAANRSEKTVDWYAYQLDTFARWLYASPVGDWFCPETLEHYLADERERGMSASTVSSRYRALRAWFNWLRVRHIVPDDVSLPTDTVEPPNPGRPIVAYVKIAEFETLYDSIDGDDWLDLRDRALLLLLFWSGLRVSETVGLAYGDVDRAGKLITVRRGKGGKARIVPCVPELIAVLGTYLFGRPVYAGGELFIASDGYEGIRGALTAEGVRQMLIRRCRAAGLRYMNPHAFRHGFAMAFLNHGMDMSAVSKAMGHSSVNVTERTYAHWLTDGLSREYAEAQARIQADRERRSSA